MTSTLAKAICLGRDFEGRDQPVIQDEPKLQLHGTAWEVPFQLSGHDEVVGAEHLRTDHFDRVGELRRDRLAPVTNLVVTTVRLAFVDNLGVVSKTADERVLVTLGGQPEIPGDDLGGSGDAHGAPPSRLPPARLACVFDREFWDRIRPEATPSHSQARTPRTSGWPSAPPDLHMLVKARLLVTQQPPPGRGPTRYSSTANWPTMRWRATS
jgi:hypothetical protein